jgi:hypothetical protein
VPGFWPSKGVVAMLRIMGVAQAFRRLR